MNGKAIVGLFVALLLAAGGGWYWGASGRWPAERALAAAELRADLLDGRGNLLEARVDLFSVNFGNASGHLEDARGALRRAAVRLKTAGRSDDAKRLDVALAKCDEAQRMSGKLDQAANGRVADAIRSIDQVLLPTPPR